MADFEPKTFTPPIPPKTPGSKAWHQAVSRRPDTLYKKNYELLDPITPKRERLFESTPKGLPAESKTFKPTAVSTTIKKHWSNK